MENFTPESLKKFLNQGRPPARGQRGETARTARGQRITDILRDRDGGAQPEQQENLDSLIRQSMGELVRKYVEANKFNELRAILHEHRKFINDILGLVENKK